MHILGIGRLSDKDELALEQIRLWIYDTAGMHYPEKKYEMLAQRLMNVATKFGFSSLAELNDALHGVAGYDLRLAVLHSASTNHTYFYREEGVLLYFRDKVLPTLPQQGKLRIWSAATSTGEEAYTLAILLTELFGAEAANRVSFLGTDISQSVISHAEQGIYDVSRLQYLPKHLLPRYFQYAGLSQFKIHDRIQKMVIFRRLNLMSAPYPFRSQFHAVFCRNVLYYFDKEDQLRVVESLYDVTLPGGWLFTSVTESLRDMPTRWLLIEPGVYRKMEGTV